MKTEQALAIAQKLDAAYKSVKRLYPSTWEKDLKGPVNNLLFIMWGREVTAIEALMMALQNNDNNVWLLWHCAAAAHIIANDLKFEAPKVEFTPQDNTDLNAIVRMDINK